VGRISEVRLGDLPPVLDRYRPVALTVGAILIIVAVLPGARHADNGAPPPATDVLAGADTPATTVPTRRATRSAAAADDTTLAADAGTVDVDVATPAIDEADTGSVVVDDGSDAATSPPPSPAPTTAPAPAFTAPPSSSTRPLTVDRVAWASASAGTPLADAGVPEDGLPVGKHAGQLDKASFVELDGTATTLVLREDSDGSRGTVAGSVQACQITEPGWRRGEAKSFDDAPEWNADRCVAGRRGANGVWRFDLARFPQRADDRGFALVPTADAPVDFQVAFKGPS
jgi:hypothetical protein